MVRSIRKIAFVSLCILCSLYVSAQKKKISMKDSLDGAFDLSDYIIDANGFVPVPVFITEPALGGFGFALVPVFLKKRPPYIDTVNGKVKYTPVGPDITGGIGLYTVNNTWMTAAFRSGTLIKSRIKYMVGAAYGSINMSYYRTVQQLGEKEFAFNIKTFAGFAQGIKRIGISNWYAGLKYLFLSTDVTYKGDPLLPPEFVKNPTLLVYAKNEKEEEIPNEEYIEELAARHFPDLSIMKLHLEPKEYFATWIGEKKNSLLVSGSFGRSSLSRVFKKSFIKDVIKDHRLPIFIVHR